MATLEEKIKAEVKKGDDTSIINLVDDLVAYAQEVRASDIHIDPTEKEVRVRLRIDGVLQQAFLFPKHIHNTIISRIKVLAGLRTDEHQNSQDGRFRLNLEDAGPTDIRVSIAPTYYGENTVLRILSDKAGEFTLTSLGFSEEDKKKIEEAAHKPTGMILSTGPTGSGKTTTLYTLIKMLNSEEVSIITIEDPIEYAISGIEQIQVNYKSGLTFANGLRSILRQDPDIIMVGEIRDSETANIAVNTALTGHLLLSTVHTNDAATTLPRLLDMKIEPFLVASTVNIAIAQRLVRRICQDCKKERPLSEADRESLVSVLPGVVHDNVMYYEGEGCDTCNDTGYLGRICVNEVLSIDNDIREAILKKSSAAAIKSIAVSNGMTTMLEDGLKKAQQGLTTITEILRVVRD